MENVLNYRAEEDYYSILGVGELATVEQIRCEYKIRAKQLHPDKCCNTSNEAAFQKLQRAKEVLTDEKTRACYDRWRSSGLAISYDEWVAKKDALHTSLHWAATRCKTPQIAATTHTDEAARKETSPASSYTTSCASELNWMPSSWQRDTESDVMKRFRNYEI